MDVRGRGLSDHPAGGFALEDYAADVAGAIEQLGLHRPVVLGHSMGGRICIASAAIYPDLHGPLVIVDPPMTGPGRARYPTPLEVFVRQLHEAYRGTSIEEVRRWWPKWPERELEIRADWLPTCDERAVVETWENFHREDIIPYWKKLRPPVLFVYGGDSPVVTPADREELAAANPIATFVGVDGTGHMIPWEDLDGFLEAIEGFLRSVER
jgi:N-formylmaleamate deformylase